MKALMPAATQQLPVCVRGNRLIGRLARFFVALALICLSGCSGHEPPPLPRFVIQGRVVDATDASVGIAGATITAEVASATATRQAAQTVTGGDGSYQLEIRIESATTVTLYITLPEGSGYRGIRIDIEAEPATTLTLTITLLPLDAPEPVEIYVVPSSATLTVGETRQFIAVVVDAEGSQLEDYQPTWTVEGGIGSITSSGLFEAENAGTGTVLATLQNVQGSASVTVVSGEGTGSVEVTIRSSEHE